MSDPKRKGALLLHCWDVSLLPTDVCPPQNLYLSGPATLYVHAGHSAESCDDSTCPLDSSCTHLTWNKVDNTTPPRAHPETEISPGAALLNTLMRQADGAAHRGRAVGVTASYHNLILPLPAQLLTVAVTEPRTRHAIKHAQAHTHTHARTNKLYMGHTPKHTEDGAEGAAGASPLAVTHCQVAGWVLSIELTKINILPTKKNMGGGEGTWRCLSFNLNQETGGSAWGWRQATEYREHVHLLTPGWLELTAERGHGVKTKMSLLLNTEHPTGHGK